MRLHELQTTTKKPSKSRVGRGISAGQGKTAGRGTKGQKSRTGANSNIPRTFEGAATGLIQRLPKLKGFKSHRIKPVTVNMARLVAVIDDKAHVTLTTLVEMGIINVKEAQQGVKIVGSSKEFEKTFTFDQEDPKLKVTKKLTS